MTVAEPRTLTVEEREALTEHLPGDGNSRLFAAVERIVAARLAAERAEWAGRVEAIEDLIDNWAHSCGPLGVTVNDLVMRQCADELRALLAQSAATEPGTAGEGEAVHIPGSRWCRRRVGAWWNILSCPACAASPSAAQPAAADERCEG